MKRLFFIYSLPRSGSAWLSMFLSQPGCCCLHEPFADGGGWSQLLERLEERPEPVAGAIDTSAYQRPGRPEVPRYRLVRPLEEIEASGRRLGFTSIDYEGELHRFSAATQGLPLIEHWRFKDLGYLKGLWQRLTGLPFDGQRAQTLTEMRIERDLSAVARRYRAHRHDSVAL